jgi:hypothetical protein
VALVAIVAALAIGIGCGAALLLAHVRTDTTSPAHAATSPSPSPSDAQDPARQAAEGSLMTSLDTPSGFQSYPADWNGDALESDSVMVCSNNACPTDPVESLATWARHIGLRAPFDSDEHVKSCIPGKCNTEFTRDGFLIYVTASEVHYGSAETRYELTIIIRPS